MSPNDDNPEEVKKARKKYYGLDMGVIPGQVRKDRLIPSMSALVKGYLKSYSKFLG